MQPQRGGLTHLHSSPLNQRGVNYSPTPDEWPGPYPEILGRGPTLGYGVQIATLKVGPTTRGAFAWGELRRWFTAHLGCPGLNDGGLQTVPRPGDHLFVARNRVVRHHQSVDLPLVWEVGRWQASETNKKCLVQSTPTFCLVTTKVKVRSGVREKSVV